MADFYLTVRKYIMDKGLESLSSLGEGRMRQAGRELAAKKISVDEAIDVLCRERDYRFFINAKEREELQKRLK